MSSILLGALELYAAIGLVAAIAFVSFGVSRVFPEPVTVSFGARLLLLPASALLWPYVIGRWVKSGRPR
jgi:hypothetical protein